MAEKDRFELVSPYKPTGDQPQAIEKLAAGVLAGDKEQTLLGVTGSGKTFTMANVIAQVNRPTLVLAHNKTLAAQLCSEFQGVFPRTTRWNTLYPTTTTISPRPISPATDTYIEKDSAINDEIEKLRHSATVVPVRAAGCHHCGQRILHLHPGRPHRLPQHGDLPAPRAWTMEPGRSASKSWWSCSTSATTSTLSATSSGCGATWWRSSPPTPVGYSSAGRVLRRRGGPHLRDQPLDR